MPQAVLSASAMTGRHNTMLPKRESSKDAPLIEDIRLLGQILGTTIREQEGDEVFERIEKIRRLSVAFERDADAEAGRRLARARAKRRLACAHGPSHGSKAQDPA